MLVRRALVGAVALVGVVLLLVGIGLRTVWLPESTWTATADLTEDAPVALTAPGVLEMRPGPVTVRVEGEGEVHLARMREEDAVAWVGESHHATVTGLTDETTLTVEDTEGEAEVPDPAGSVMWLDGETGDGSAELTWQDAPGRYLLVAAGDGTTAPTSLTLTWPREAQAPWAVPLMVAGGLALVGAVVLALLLGLLGRRTRPATAGTTGADDAVAPPPPAPTTGTEEVSR